MWVRGVQPSRLLLVAVPAVSESVSAEVGGEQGGKDQRQGL